MLADVFYLLDSFFLLAGVARRDLAVPDRFAVEGYRPQPRLQGVGVSVLLAVCADIVHVCYRPERWPLTYRVDRRPAHDRYGSDHPVVSGSSRDGEFD